MAQIAVSSPLEIASFVASLFNHTFWMPPDCGNVLTPGAIPASSSNCDSVCVGNSSEICGGSVYLSLYTNGQPPQPQPTVVLDVPSATSWEFVGCLK